MPCLVGPIMLPFSLSYCVVSAIGSVLYSTLSRTSTGLQLAMFSR